MRHRLLSYTLTVIIISFYALGIEAQCPTQAIAFTTQDEVDQFILDFPNCTELDFDLVIKPGNNSAIVNLEPLSNLTTINGGLIIEGDLGSDVTDLYAFRNLMSVEKVNIQFSNVVNFHNEINWNVRSTLNISRCHEFTSFGNITLNSSMEEITLLDLGLVPSEEYDILNQIDTVEVILISGTNVLSLGPEINIHVLDDFAVNNNFSLIRIDGFSFDSKMTQFQIFVCPELQGPINSMMNLIEVDFFTFGGGNFIKTLPPIPSLQKVEKLNLSRLSEMDDLLILDNVIIEHDISLFNMDINSLEGIHLDTITSVLQEITLSSLDQIANLDGLKFPDVLSRLKIKNCDFLSNLTGIDDVYNIKDLELSSLPMLENLEGFNSLRVVDRLEIEDCEFKSLQGLEQLEGIQEHLILSDNQKLENLNGPNNFELIGSPLLFWFNNKLEITGNPKLNSIHMLSNAISNIEELIIKDNSQLASCSIAPICQALSSSAFTIDIENNLTGCNSAQEVLDSCRNNQILVYHDFDENNQRDAGETDLPIGRINVNDSYEILPNNTNGNFSFYDVGQNAFMEYIPDEHWDITGPSNIYNLDSDTINNIEIGIIPTAEIHDIDVSLAFDQIICAETYALSAIVKNVGTTRKDVQLLIEGHGSLIFGSEEIELTNMSPGEVENITLDYTAAGVSEITPGDLIELKATVTFEDETGSIIEKVKSYETIFLCAYDPNDKQVFPAGVQEENYTLFEDNTLEYKIRFQNTGNFPAEDIVIIDTLSDFLNLSTLKYLHSSHPISEIKLDRNVVSFSFEDIFLIDSLANEPESHGYVQFSIETMEDLTENTVIYNTAHIYFDSNPAIVTNTVFNTFVSEIPPATSNENLTEQGFKLMPKPSRDFITVETTFAERDKQWKIYNQLGQEVMQGFTNNQIWEINISELDTGLYFIELNNFVHRIIKIE